MSKIKNFKLRKIYQRKKNFTLKNTTVNNYILLISSNKIRIPLSDNISHINYIPSYLQTEGISTGGVIVQVIPTKFDSLTKENNTNFKEYMSIFYDNKWYPGYLFKGIKNYKKNLLSILILLKELKLK